MLAVGRVALHAKLLTSQNTYPWGTSIPAAVQEPEQYVTAAQPTKGTKSGAEINAEVCPAPHHHPAIGSYLLMLAKAGGDHCDSA